MYSSSTAGFANFLPGLLILLIIAGAVGLGFLFWWLQEQKVKQYQAWAAARGWHYNRSAQHLVYRYNIRPFGVGDSRRAMHLFQGDFYGMPASAFHYQYQTGDDKNKTTHRFTIYTLLLPAVFPGVTLAPEGIFRSLLAVFGARDIQLESEEFNKAWKVQGDDLKFVHDVLHPRQMERLMMPDARGRVLYLTGNELVTWIPGHNGPEEIDRYLPFARDFADGIPDFIWHELKIPKPSFPGRH